MQRSLYRGRFAVSLDSLAMRSGEVEIAFLDIATTQKNCGEEITFSIRIQQTQQFLLSNVHTIHTNLLPLMSTCPQGVFLHGAVLWAAVLRSESNGRVSVLAVRYDYAGEAQAELA